LNARRASRYASIVADAISLRAETVAPIAATVARTHRLASRAVLAMIAVVFAIACHGFRQHEAGPWTLEAIGWVLALAYLGATCAMFWYSARRANGAALAAERDGAVAWALRDSFVTASDAGGAARPELSFFITARLRDALLAVPDARVVRG
jgi:hypothetical protein